MVRAKAHSRVLRKLCPVDFVVVSKGSSVLLLLSVVMSYVDCADDGLDGLMIVRVELSTMSNCIVHYTPR